MENYRQWMEQKLTSEDMDKLPKAPLNDDTVLSLIKDYELDDVVYRAIKLVRAVEKAHGIV